MARTRAHDFLTSNFHLNNLVLLKLFEYLCLIKFELVNK